MNVQLSKNMSIYSFKLCFSHAFDLEVDLKLTFWAHGYGIENTQQHNNSLNGQQTFHCMSSQQFTPVTFTLCYPTKTPHDVFTMNNRCTYGFNPDTRHLKKKKQREVHFIVCCKLSFSTRANKSWRTFVFRWTEDAEIKRLTRRRPLSAELGC